MSSYDTITQSYFSDNSSEIIDKNIINVLFFNSSAKNGDVKLHNNEVKIYSDYDYMDFDFSFDYYINKMINRFYLNDNDLIISDIKKELSEVLNNMKTKFIIVSDFEAIIAYIVIKNLKSYKVEWSPIFHDFVKNTINERLNTNHSYAEDDLELNDIKVVRRNFNIVHFNAYKIYNVLKRIFESVKYNDYVLNRVFINILDKIQKYRRSVLSLDIIQYTILESLLDYGISDVAEYYIKFRFDKSVKRNTIYPNSSNTIIISEENGVETVVDDTFFNKIYDFCARDLDLLLTREQVINNLKRSLYNGISRKDFNKALLLNAKSMMEYGYDFSYFAGRLLNIFIYEETLGWYITHSYEDLVKAHREKFKSYIKYAVKNGYLDRKMLKFDLDYLSQFLDPEKDLWFTYLGVQTLYDRYFISHVTKDTKVRLENLQFFWMRVAMGLHINEIGTEGVEDRIVELFNHYINRRLCSSTPTLFNSGTKRPQLSSCYLYVVDDSIESIMEMGIAKASYLSKWAGGLGGSWTRVRGNGALIRGTGGKSNGVIPFLKIHNDMLVAVNQGGKRQGSGAVYLETWHSDIFQFLELRKNTGDERVRTHDTNTANWIPDLFMKRVEERSYWTLFHSSDVYDLHDLYGKAFEEKYLEYEKMYEEGKIWGMRVEALELWKQMLRMLYETGHPWMTFKDPCNIRSPQDHVGVVHSSNLCTEITLNTSHDEVAVCNLASIVLPSFVKDKKIDYDMLRSVIRTAVRVLDNVIDINFYPIKEAENANKRHRAVGLGMMGWHDLLFELGVDFDSDEATKLADELMEFIAYCAYEASSDLAVSRGKYPSFEGSKWSRGILPLDTIDILEKERGVPVNVNRECRLDWEYLRHKIMKDGMRNSNVIAIAPTATISNIMGTSPSIEPYYSNMYVKSNLTGDFVIINKYLERYLKSINLWNINMIKKIKYYDGELSMIEEIPEEIKKSFKTAFDIDYKFIIDQAAVRQKWIDQSQSVNLFLKDPNMKTLSHMYKYAWRCGLKTTYYLRTLGASKIEKSSVSKFDLEQDNNISGMICRWNAEAGEGECEACQ